MFTDRKDAGKKLAAVLAKYRGTQGVVIALPRGGVVLGAEVAKALQFPLDIVAPRKIGHPMHPEYAIGVVDEGGTCILNTEEAKEIDSQWLAEEVRQQQREAQRRIAAYRSGRAPTDVAGKTVILVDDGIATGLTMRLALRSVKARMPEKIIVAVPVAPPGSEGVLRSEGVDEVIVLEPPESFSGAVGAHYVRFDQVKDEEVIRLMREHL